MAEARVFAAGSFVGRAAELEIFQSALDTTLRDGRGLTLFVRGEAGIGKTRLLHEFQRLAQMAGFHHHGGQVLDFGVGEGQDAIGILLRGLLDLTPGAGHNQRTAAAQTAAEAGLTRPEQRLHLNDLLSLPQNPEEAVLYEAMDNEQRNRGRVDALVTLVKGLSKQALLLLEIENLHWAQPALLDYLTALAVAAGDHRILLLLSSRVQGDPLEAAWYDGIAPAPARILDLKPLTTEEARDFIFDFEGVDRERAAACIERSGGNPLFLEQLLRSPGGDDGAIIPGSVQSVVQARIDALPARDRAALQAASVLGQRFALDAMRHVMNDSAYQPDDLLHFNMIRRYEGAFQFYHALFRDAVHGSFLTERRRNLHLRAADWFQDRDAVLYAEHLGAAASDR
ncbi:MAG: AAA family ATPase, partial [Alphaproteobacteria bacterium]